MRRNVRRRNDIYRDCPRATSRRDRVPPHLRQLLGILVRRLEQGSVCPASSGLVVHVPHQVSWRRHLLLHAGPRSVSGVELRIALRRPCVTRRLVLVLRAARTGPPSNFALHRTPTAASFSRELYFSASGWRR